MSMVKNENFKIIKGKEKLTIYKFHSKIAKHYFCSICGIYTHHNPRSNPAMTGFNLGCIDEIDTFNLKNIHANDIAELLNTNDIYIRSGHHCCQPLHHHYGIKSSARASLSFTSTINEIDILESML